MQCSRVKESPSKPRTNIRRAEVFYFYHGVTAPSRPALPHYGGFAIIFKHITVGKTPLEE
jgi:hypothetical protein